MPFTELDRDSTNNALKVWRQGDVSLDDNLKVFHLADLSRPHSDVSKEVSKDKPKQTNITTVLDSVEGIVMLTQTCEIVRCCLERPFVEIAPLIKLKGDEVEEVRRLKRPRYAYIPSVADKCYVADLDRPCTVEKVIVAGWNRKSGWQDDDEFRNFSKTLTRKRSRFAFPDDFVTAAQKLQSHLKQKHNRQSKEGKYLRALREIRVRAAPSWDSDQVELTWYFIRNDETADELDQWDFYIEKWLKKFEQGSRFRIEEDYDEFVSYRLNDLTAEEYVESSHLDLDQLSII